MATSFFNYSGTSTWYSIWNVRINYFISNFLIDYAFFTSCQSIQNLGLAVGSILAGIIVDHAGYVWLEVFFIGNLVGEHTV